MRSIKEAMGGPMFSNGDDSRSRFEYMMKQNDEVIEDDDDDEEFRMDFNGHQNEQDLVSYSKEDNLSNSINLVNHQSEHFNHHPF